ncbi:MAG: hypothetical protein GIW95_06270, partial [Candidatus Eremiobacteraeota bacterium]|nr:hypothetical protein [Candidatus Eremiobacteraeota bacterium]
MRRFVSLSLFFALAAGLVQPVRVHAAAPDAKIPIDYKAYDSWNLVRGTKLSDDGNWIAYALVPEDGDPVLVVRDFATGKETREERGISPVFTADSKFVVYTIRAKNDDIHKAEREHKLPAEQPKSGLGILELATGKTTTFERVKSVKVPADPGTTTIAFAFEAPSPSPKPSGAPSPRATPPLIVPAEAPEVMRPPVAAPASAAPNVRVPLAAPVGTAPPELGPSPGPSLPATGATPSPSASPDDLHKIEDGTELVVRDLPSGKEYRTKSVGEYAIAHDGAYVAFANQAKDKKLDALRIRTSSNGHITSMMGEGHYRNLTFAPKQPAFALESDASSFADKAPHY